MKKILGIELGSTRIKAVLLNENAELLSQGIYDWENIKADGLWSYDMSKVFIGLRESYADLVRNYGEPIETLDAVGISAMMHGYLAFDEKDNLLAPFRTWRNTNTPEAAAELSELFGFNIPMRWSVSQYYQSVLDGMDHVKKVTFLTTLSGYVHYCLTGRKVLGIGDASGMFPIDDDKEYNKEMLVKFDALLKKHGMEVRFKDLLPEILISGQNAGALTEEGAKILDPTGTLKPGCPLCPPEGDMGTGMVCTNSVRPETANASLGTSANLTVILNKNLKGYYPELDVITTPEGSPAALIHTNTCTSVIDRWASIFAEFAKACGMEVKKGKIYDVLYEKSTEADLDVGGVAAYNYLAGEPIPRTVGGAPMFFATENGNLNLANFSQAQVYSAIAVLALGLEKLKAEDVRIRSVYGHGGYLKTPVIGQTALSALIGAPVTVMTNAGEGGAWGIAVLALYMLSGEKSLSDYLDRVFASTEKTVLEADEKEKAKFAAFMVNYKNGLDAERVLAEKVNG